MADLNESRNRGDMDVQSGKARENVASLPLGSKAKAEDTTAICDTKSDARSDSNVRISEGVFTEHSYSSIESARYS